MGKAENGVQEAVISYLLLRGCYVWRNNSGAVVTERGQFMRYGKPGSSDVIGVTPLGIFIAIECKTDDRRSKPTDLQLDFLEEVKRRGGIGLVVKPSDWQEQIDAALADSEAAA